MNRVKQSVNLSDTVKHLVTMVSNFVQDCNDIMSLSTVTDLDPIQDSESHVDFFEDSFELNHYMESFRE